jgi:hypothetical protein
MLLQGSILFCAVTCSEARFVIQILSCGCGYPETGKKLASQGSAMR